MEDIIPSPAAAQMISNSKGKLAMESECVRISNVGLSLNRFNVVAIGCNHAIRMPINYVAFRYTDRVHIHLSSSGSSCMIHSCSRSQVNSYKDFSTNYCNIVSLYCGSKDGRNCRPVAHDFSNTELSHKKHAGASANRNDCKLGNPGVVVVKGRNLRAKLSMK